MERVTVIAKRRAELQLAQMKTSAAPKMQTV
jgi:hypothetical protein